MATSVSVYVQGSDALGKVFGTTQRVRTAVYTLPPTVSAFTAALQRSSTDAVLLVESGQTTKASSAQIASALDKLATKREPVVAYLGAGRHDLFLNAPAVALVRAALTAEPVTLPTRSDDNVPGEENFAPSPVLRETPFAAKALATLNPYDQLDTLIATGAIKVVDAGVLFVSEHVPAPAERLTDVDASYRHLMISSPVSSSRDFQGSPTSTEASVDRAIPYYNPNTETTSFNEPIAANATSSGGGTATSAPTDVMSSWWLWLIIVLILVILLIVSVVVYYRR